MASALAHELNYTLSEISNYMKVSRNRLMISPARIALLRGTIESCFDLRRVGVGAASQQAARSLHVVADRRQRLVQFMGEGGSHFPMALRRET